MLEVKNLCVYAQFAHGEDVIVKDVSFACLADALLQSWESRVRANL